MDILTSLFSIVILLSLLASCNIVFKSAPTRLACKLSIAQLVGFLVVQHVHPSLSSQLDVGVLIFLNLFHDSIALFFQ
jgi:hypothetical protein